MYVTYDQFLDAATKSGLYFSDYDMQLAKQNPNAGFGILNAKQDYAKATTAEAKALAHENAESWRKQGTYSGGADGSFYNPIQQNVEKSTGNGTADALTNRMLNYSSFNYDPAPEFNDSYKPLYDQQLNNMLNYKDFSYDYNSDPLYQQYKQAYNREGQRAMENTLAETSARTGGLASSYAASAAAQANNYYAQQLADKIPDLYQLAYQQYTDKYNRTNNNVNTLMGARNFDLGVYDTQLGQYNTDRNFAYGQYADNYNRLGNNLGIILGQDDTAYNRGRDTIADQRYNTEWDAAMAQQALENGRYDTEWEYKTGQASMNDARSRIQSFLSAGGDVNAIPDDVIAASGLTREELQQMALAMAPGVSGGRYGSGNTVEELPNPNLVDYDSAVGKQLVGVSSDDPLMAGDILTNNWNNLGYTERFSLLQNMGYDNATAIQLARGDSADMAAYLYGLQNPTPSEPVSTGVDVSGITNYSDATELLGQYESKATPLSVSDWNKTKADGKSQFNTYTDYLKAFVDYHING